VFGAAYGICLASGVLAVCFGYFLKYMLGESESTCDHSGGRKGRRRGRSWGRAVIRDSRAVALWADVARWDGGCV
jgi:hypothetical protein